MRGGIPASIPDAVASEGIDCDDSVFSRSEWRFQPAAVSSLFDRIMASGRPLGEVVNGRIYYGVKTGLNEAFILDRPTRDRLVAADPGCVGIIRKMLRGEDLRPWYYQDEGRFLIVMPSGFTRQGMGAAGAAQSGVEPPQSKARPDGSRGGDPRPDTESRQRRDSLDCCGLTQLSPGAGTHSGIEPAQPHAPAAAWGWIAATYPAIAAHLAPFAEAAQRRTDQGEFWWELRSCAYYSAFDEPKILWPDIAKLPRFSWDTGGAYMNNTGYILPGESWLLPVLASRLLWFTVSQVATPLRLRGGLWQFRCINQFMERLPVVVPDEAGKQALADLATQAGAIARERYALHEQVRHRLRSDFAAGGGLNQALTDWWELDFFALRQQLEKAFRTRIPVAERQDWETTLAGWQQSHASLTTRLVSIEGEINDRVYALFGLAPADIALLDDHAKHAMINYPLGEP
jgi:hypothetical protein